MVWNFLFGFLAGVVCPLVIGFPIAVLLGLGRGMAGVGYAAACGISVVLVTCRAVQMLWPISQVWAWMLAGFAALAMVLWSLRAVRQGLAELLAQHRRPIGIVLAVASIVGALLCAPILFGNAIQFEGSRNADSFTFTSNARYMLEHSFNGPADFSPEDPVYTISRSYFGDGATQPRPAAEGFLAWLSAVRGVDPMYLYNSVQAAGLVLAGLSILAFLPLGWRPGSRKEWGLTLMFLFGCPGLLHLAINSNFANILNIAAVTGYVALGLRSRTRLSFLAAVLFLGCLLSGYPEMIIFVLAVRGLGAIAFALHARSVREVPREALWLISQLVVACMLLPWAAHGTYAVYRTTMMLSKAGASELGGDMYAGVPVFLAAALALWHGWKGLGESDSDGRIRTLLSGVLAAFAAAQAVMLARGFDYGGFKLSQYFITLMMGVLVVTLPALLARPARSGRKASRMATFVVVVAALMAVRSTHLLNRSWHWSEVRSVTPELVQAGEAMKGLSHGRPIALGATPQPFYYGMWVAYVARAPIAYDLARDPRAAGHLSPYLQTVRDQATAMYDEASWELSIDAPNADASQSGDAVATFGSVRISARAATPPLT